MSATAVQHPMYGRFNYGVGMKLVNLYCKRQAENMPVRLDAASDAQPE